MKKIFYTLALAAMIGGTATAQNNPERMLVIDNAGGYKGFLVERVSEVQFPKLEGKVEAEIKLKDVSDEAITFTVTRTAACSYYKFDVVSASVANQLTDDARAASYLDQSSTTTYYEDFTNGSIQTDQFSANSDYVAMTVAYDKYGIACGVSRASFTTPKAKLTGSPKVAYTIDNISAREFTITFIPNEDVAGYACVEGEKGSMQSQYDMYATWFGFNNFSEMIKSWGYNEGSSSSTHTWDNLDANTQYQVFVQAWDANGVFADCDTIEITTDKLGGSGAAYVDVQLGDYKLQDWNGEQLPSQFITFTPNDQASCYRYNVILASNYDTDSQGYIDDLCSDPSQPMAYWFNYGTLTTDFQINPSTQAVAIAAAKNSEGVWGEVNVLRFTTPTSASTSKAPAKWNPASVITARLQPTIEAWTIGNGKAPAFKSNKGIQLRRS